MATYLIRTRLSGVWIATAQAQAQATAIATAQATAHAGAQAQATALATAKAHDDRRAGSPPDGRATALA